MVVIDGFRYGFFEPLIEGHPIGVVVEVGEEARHYKGAGGEKVPINLQPYVDTGRVRMESPTLHEVRALRQTGRSRRLGKGEFASLALVLARHHRFCTADKRAPVP